MQQIPIQDIPSQTLTVVLGGQSCLINIYQKRTGVYIDLYVNNVVIVTGALCINLVKIIKDKYLGFIGDLCFNDNQGSNDPTTPGLGSRYEFIYLESTDL